MWTTNKAACPLDLLSDQGVSVSAVEQGEQGEIGAASPSARKTKPETAEQP
jgi:hypothetical protein